MKKHFLGATYDVNQENMQNLIQQLEDSRLDFKRVDAELDDVRAENERLNVLLKNLTQVSNQFKITIEKQKSEYNEVLEPMFKEKLIKLSAKLTKHKEAVKGLIKALENIATEYVEDECDVDYNPHLNPAFRISTDALSEYKKAMGENE